MKTIILYATKYGAAGEIAKRIADRIDGSAIHNLKDGFPSLTEYDCIIFGSSVYAGMIRKEAKTFLSLNAQILLEKKLGLFLCGISREEEDTYFSANFAPNLLQKATAKCLPGGIFDPEKAGAFERLIMKAVAKSSAYINTINDKKIERFTEAMKS